MDLSKSGQREPYRGPSTVQRPSVAKQLRLYAANTLSSRSPGELGDSIGSLSCAGAMGSAFGCRRPRSFSATGLPTVRSRPFAGHPHTQESGTIQEFTYLCSSRKQAKGCHLLLLGVVTLNGVLYSLTLSAARSKSTLTCRLGAVEELPRKDTPWPLFAVAGLALSACRRQGGMLMSGLRGQMSGTDAPQRGATCMCTHSRQGPRDQHTDCSLSGACHMTAHHSEVPSGQMPTRVPEPGAKMFWRPPDSMSGSLRMLLGSMRRLTRLSLSWRPASRLEASIAAVWVMPQ